MTVTVPSEEIPESEGEAKWIVFPRNIVIGKDVLAELPQVLYDQKQGSSVLIITGKHTREVAADAVLSLLKDRYSVSIHIAGPIDQTGIDLAGEAAKKADLLIGVGGGRIIDTTKIVSYNQNKPFISIPTAASHDGIVSNRASIPLGEGNASIQARPPIAVIADTGIIAEAPFRLLASGCADIISNYTAILDWELANRIRGDHISRYALAISKMTAEMLVSNADLIKPGNLDAVDLVVRALVSSGMAMSIAGSSRPASGAEHKFGHAVERLVPGKALHGEICGIGTIMMMYLHGGDWKTIRQSLQRIGAPVTPAEVDIPDSVIVQALLHAKDIRPERFTIIDMGLSPKAAEDLVRLLYT
ncbi:MAG: NAD(P)-dependent glycerol-1-phosphate dehydrogenase [Methanospirillaceae archaeon]|nr:NAD(P)-dependent glycerol-1-phosphate dehydrogenase [Methanospirillaceae archaeon]